MTSDHDPLCRGASGTFCDCPLIARVREDERRRYDDDGAERDIRARALRDAVEAVKALEYDGPYCKVVHSCDAITAIKALRGTDA